MTAFPNKQNYKILEVLGQGSFGSAYKVLNEENNRIYVMKKIIIKDAKDKELQEIKKEAIILSCINSENIVKYINSFFDKESFNIIMEYCDGLDLRKYINDHKKTNDFIKKDLIYHIISGICAGLKEIHKNNLIHRDLKPENLFLTNDLKVKIGDFGIAKKLNNVNEYAKTQAGTMLYMAPEIINGEKYNNKVDIWSLGCIIHELCTFNYCFESPSINGLITKITKGKHEKIDKNIYGDDLQNLIDLLLDENYKKRPNVEEVIRIINVNLGKSFLDKIISLLEGDESYQNHLIEKNIQNSIDQVSLTVLSREQKYNTIKHYFGLILLLPIGFLSGLLGPAGFILAAGIGATYGLLSNKLLGTKEKQEFISDNCIIIDSIKIS